MTVPVPGQRNRYVFALPHPTGSSRRADRRPVDGPLPEVPRADEAEIAFLLDTLSRGLDRPLSRATSSAPSPGVRPLLAGAEGRTADLSRRHAVVRATTASGPCSAASSRPTGGWRRTPSTGSPTCRAAPPSLPLVGAPARAAGVPERLVRRYGAEAGDVAPSPARPAAAGARSPGRAGARGSSWLGHPRGVRHRAACWSGGPGMSRSDAWHEAAQAACVRRWWRRPVEAAAALDARV
jgi:glycerol-3-phosphate dehydrogenase